jgi:hypothetical protein
MPPAGMSFVRIDGQRIAGKVPTTTTPRVVSMTVKKILDGAP